ncbi:hypothetical protein ERJ75_001432200 [Trypanosoma vivax]|uniref:C2H2-type domain-containing protein n=1 Tax=Trypanosoma vivax (strain Y486) TaxID=1055687 RepID=G0TTL6_TRYVY|nr:hypothetical protein TRVL_09327 [Trypanosoma vivax]KAH8606889.1 hypothetical protein ERJ75_001432400 [Trypanosoma vivax]KAH8607187.1 hypothetical protein ERJ75_001432200 [Trypanosoma vivax]CCC47297.1 conserved hypothetical protein [Trypanosoma vivax Y486]
MLLTRLLLAVTTINSSTASASGRLIRIRKKTKWIDRRSKRVPHNGKDVWLFGEQPSCALCHVRFRYKQDYEAHKESELHQNRLRWVETINWWKDVGEPHHQRHTEKEWEWFRLRVLPEKAAAMGLTTEEAERELRRAVMHETPHWCGRLQPPNVRSEIKEPRDQRWPASPKW